MGFRGQGRYKISFGHVSEKITPKKLGPDIKGPHLFIEFFSIFINIAQWHVSVVCKRSLLKLLQDFEEKNVLGYVIISVQAHLCKNIISLKQSVQKLILYPNLFLAHIQSFSDICRMRVHWASPHDTSYKTFVPPSSFEHVL